jgi:Ala-tRNA(Pro) deacylase
MKTENIRNHFRKQVEIKQNRQRVFDALRDLGINFQIFDHPPIRTSGDAFLLPEDVEGGRCKNLFLRNNEGTNHYLVILGLESRCDLKILARKLNEKRLGFASEDRLMRFLGVSSGSVSPFNLLNGNGKEVIIVVEEALLSQEKLAFHPNENTATLVLSVEDFMKYLRSSENRIDFVDLSV